jgi:hypothetical protein
MKKRVLLLLPVVALFGIILFSQIGCDSNPLESCEQEEICTGKSVTACCTEGSSCKYTFNGKVYSEDELTQLAKDLGCTSRKSTCYDEEIVELVSRLEALMERAHAGLYK